MTTTINKEEIQKFSKLADEWWDVNGLSFAIQQTFYHVWVA